MLKPLEIVEIKPYYIVCKFNNDEIRQLNIADKLDSQNKYVQKILNKDIFLNAQLGEFGQIFWNFVAEMKNEQGEIINCEYDISPEFIYYNSQLIYK